MTLFSAYITAPYQGVSQAPPQARLPEQAEALEDSLVTIPQGWQQRPPMTWDGILAGHNGSRYGLFQQIPASSGTGDTELTLCNVAGVVTPLLYLQSDFPSVDGSPVAAQPVTISSDAQAYLNYGNPTPVQDLVAISIEDVTFICNRKRPVLKSADHAPTRPYEAMLWVRSGAYARTYTATVTPSTGTPVTATAKTPDGTDASDGTYADTEVIARILLGDGSWTTNNGASHSGTLTDLTAQGFTVTRYGPVIYISHPTVNFTVSLADGQGGVAFTAVKEKVQDFADLPKKAVNGFLVRITQSTSSDNDDFFVSYQATVGQDNGIWQECLGPGAELGLDPKTMPVGLVYDGGWQLKVLDWKQRTVGDEKLAPDPDFVGRAIMDIRWFRGRLALISGEEVMLSSGRTPYRFYPETLSSVIDDDPISLLSPFPQKSTFHHAVEFNEKLIVFAEKYQAVVSADGPLTLSNARIDILMTYESSLYARPQESNGKVYFVAPHGALFSTVYEVKVNNLTAVTDAEDMTIAVPRYVPSKVDRIASCPVNYLICYASSVGSSIYCHLFRYAENQRVQNAWMRWNLPEGFVLGGMWFDNTELHLLLVNDVTAHRVRIDTSPELLDDGDASATILTHLDLRMSDTQVTRSYDPTYGYTTISLPYAATMKTRAVVRAPGGVGGEAPFGQSLPVLPEGYLAPQVTISGNTLILKGDWTQAPLYIGQSFKALWRMSRLYAVGQDNQPLMSGRLSIRRLVANLADTSYVRCEVTAKGRPARHYEFTGYTLDDPSVVWEEPAHSDGDFSVPILTQNTQMTVDWVNDSHLPGQVLGVEWRGELNTKAQRIT